MSAVGFDGRRDTERAAAALAGRLPESLGGLAVLAFNYHWSWQRDGEELFRCIDPQRWASVVGNPVHLLQEASYESLARAAADGDLLGRIARAEATLAASLARPPAIDEACPPARGPSSAPSSACTRRCRSTPAVSERSPATSSNRRPTTRCRSSASACSTARGTSASASTRTASSTSTGSKPIPIVLPRALVTGADGAPLTWTCRSRASRSSAQIWRVNVGRVPLYLLDTDRPENTRAARWITSRLYVGDPEVRLAQYLLLGVGGVRALAAMGIERQPPSPQRGSCRIRRARARTRADSRPARVSSRHSRRFARGWPSRRTLRLRQGTTPIRSSRLPRAAGGFVAEAGIGIDTLARLGRSHPQERAEPFGITQFALRTSRAANAVSRRHGVVAREMWQEPVAGAGRSSRCRSATSPTASTCRPGSVGRCAGCSTATCPRAGWPQAGQAAVWERG